VLTIAWDVDDVLNDLMYAWFHQSWQQLHPESQLQYSDLITNPPHQLLGVSLPEYLDTLDRFRLDGSFQRLEPKSELLDWFEQWGSQFRHIALTATPITVAPISAAWVTSHFGEWIRCFGFVPSCRVGESLPIYDQSKGDFLQWWGKADILIDDSPSNIVAAEAVGVKTILMPQPWNQSQLTTSATLDLLVSLL
jgi:hypothetical protein